MAEYEHDEETNPKNVARPMDRGPCPSSSSEICWVETHASTPPAMANPMTSAHQVIHAIAAVVVAACRVLSTTNVPSGFVVVTTPMATVITAMTERIA
jgi:hypothetical protein